MSYVRNMDMIRNTLLEIEGGRRMFCTLPKSHAAAMAMPEEDALDDHLAQVLEYHLSLVENAGFVEFQKRSGSIWSVEGLTWQGHEFLDNIRAQDIWDKTKEQADNLGGFSMQVVGELAKGFVKTKIAKHTGIEL